MRTSWRWLFVLAAPLWQACATTSYMRATAPYADAVASGTKAFTVAFDDASVVCRRRAELDRVRHLVEGSAGNVDWKSHCEGIADASKVHRRAVAVLQGHAEALKALATGASYDGAGWTAASEGTAELSKAAGMGKAEAAYVGAMGPALTQLSTFVLSQYASHQIQRAILDASPPVEAILTAMGKYLDAREQQLSLYSSEADELLKDAEFILTAPPRVEGSVPAPERGRVAPLEAFEFVDLVSQREAELKAMTSEQESLRGIVDELRKAEEELKKAGDRDTEELKVVVQSALDAFQHAQEVLKAGAAVKE